MDYALITGASGGIGYALAEVFAANGWGLLLSASRAGRLEDAQAKLAERFRTPVRLFPQELSKPGAAQALYDRVKGADFTVSALVNGAGFGLLGPAELLDTGREEAMLAVNTAALTTLTKLCLREMLGRGWGYILNIASTGAFQPGPFNAGYFASKAYVLSYTRAVRWEVRGSGVHISALCPGTTDTGFFAREGTAVPAGAMAAGEVALAGYRGLMRNREIIVPGVRNRLLRLIPTGLKMAAVGRVKRAQARKKREDA